MTPQDSARIRYQIANVNGYDVDALVNLDQELRADRTPNADTQELIRDIERKSADIVSQALLRGTNDGTAFSFARRVAERGGNATEFTLSDVMGDQVMSGYVRQIIAEHNERSQAFETASARYQALATRMEGAQTVEALDQAWGDADAAAADLSVAEFQRLSAVYEAQQAILQGRSMQQVEDIAGTAHLRDMAARTEDGTISREDALAESEMILEGVAPERARETINAQAAERRAQEDEDFDEDDEDDEDEDLDGFHGGRSGGYDEDDEDLAPQPLSADGQAVQAAIGAVALGDVAGMVALETRILAMPAGREKDDLHSRFEAKVGPVVQAVLAEMRNGPDGMEAFMDRIRERTGQRNQFTLMDMVGDDEVSVLVRTAAQRYPATQAPAAQPVAQPDAAPSYARDFRNALASDVSSLADRLAADLVESSKSLEERLMDVINSGPEFAEMESAVPGFRQSLAKLAKAAADIAKARKA